MTQFTNLLSDASRGGPVNIFTQSNRGTKLWLYAGKYEIAGSGMLSPFGMGEEGKKELKAVLRHHWKLKGTKDDEEALLGRMRAWGFKSKRGLEELERGERGVRMAYVGCRCVAFDEESFGVWSKVRERRPEKKEEEEKKKKEKMNTTYLREGKGKGRPTRRGSTGQRRRLWPPNAGY